MIVLMPLIKAVHRGVKFTTTMRQRDSRSFMFPLKRIQSQSLLRDEGLLHLFQNDLVSWEQEHT